MSKINPALGALGAVAVLAGISAVSSRKQGGANHDPDIKELERIIIETQQLLNRADIPDHRKDFYRNEINTLRERVDRLRRSNRQGSQSKLFDRVKKGRGSRPASRPRSIPGITDQTIPRWEGEDPNDPDTEMKRILSVSLPSGKRLILDGTPGKKAWLLDADGEARDYPRKELLKAIKKLQSHPDVIAISFTGDDLPFSTRRGERDMDGQAKFSRILENGAQFQEDGDHYAWPDRETVDAEDSW